MVDSFGSQIQKMIKVRFMDGVGSNPEAKEQDNQGEKGEENKNR